MMLRGVVGRGASRGRVATVAAAAWLGLVGVAVPADGAGSAVAGSPPPEWSTRSASASASLSTSAWLSSSLSASALSASALSASSLSASASASSTAGPPAWEWPLPEHRLVAPYEAPATRYAAGHRGVDFPAAPGAAVRAPDTAVVRFSGVVVDRPVLTLDHGDGVLSSFEPLLSELPVGSIVARGAVLGTVGSGGHCSTACLHVGVRVDGEYVSPMLYFARVPPAVLLPLGGG